MKRREGLAKLTGRERYVDDLPVDDCLWGVTVRSPAPRGRIADVLFDPSIDWSEFVIVDHRDIPGKNCVLLMEDDQPALTPGYVRHKHEPVLLLAHASRDVARRAATKVEVVVEPDRPIFDPLAAPANDQIQYGTDNVFKRLEINKGDVERALEEAPIVVEGVYHTGAQEHVYIEPQGMLAYGDGDVLVIEGSMQCPFYIEKALLPLLDLTRERLRVVQRATGGGFGGKEEYPSMLAAHAALLALESGRPVKMVYDRSEDMAATTKRHPSTVRHRTGVDTDGRLLAQDIEVVLDGGAYVTLSPVVLSRSVIHAAGPYACDNVRILGRCMFTNSVPYGAFRGFGNPQGAFGVERHMDVIAHRLRRDPVDLRRVNLIRDGQSTSTGQLISDGADRLAVLEKALDMSGYREKRRVPPPAAASSASQPTAASNGADSMLRRGIGVATIYHGAGFTGAGEVYLDSLVHVAGLPDGRLEVRTSCVEMGQGTTTVFTQLAADRLGLDADDVSVPAPDTHQVPNSGPTVASRTAMIVGGLVEGACDDLRRRLVLPDDARGQAVKDAVVAWHQENARGQNGDELVGEARYQAPPGIEWDDEKYEGDAYGAFGWSTHVAEVEVDLRTYGIRVLDYVAVQDVGRVLNTTLARGQIQGGVAQGLGWVLMEDCVLHDGAMENTQLTNYVIPTSGDLPPIRVDFLETPYPYGAQGAKGLGELPFNGPAPAVLNAVADALGVEPTVVPLTPERLMELLDDV
jgi:CO/xanthine dehydrogenase Mo-binding subunit